MKKNVFHSAIVLLLALMFTVLAACTPASGSGSSGRLPDDDDSVDFTDLSVREATGENGVVTSANAYASKAGLTVLEEGGNAYDAAVATAFALGVVEPYASGIGGGGVMTAYDAKTGSYKFYNFREFVPAKGTPEAYEEKGGNEAMDEGITSVGVPTEVAGLCKIYDDLGSGKLSLAEVLAPAISYARDGFVIEKTLANEIRDGADGFDKNDVTEAQDTFFEEGIDPLGVGDTLKQENYAKVLDEIAKKGKDGFYTGWVAEAIVKASDEKGGFITMDDLTYASEKYPKISEPLHGTYRGYDIYTSNLPSSGGIILVEALNMLEHYQELNNTTLKEIGNNSAEYVHLISTAMQLSYADKRHYIADDSVSPVTGERFNNVPMIGLMNKGYAAQRFDALYNPDNTFVATSSYDWGGANRSAKYPQYNDDKAPTEYETAVTALSAKNTDEQDEHWSTTSFSVADKDGNIVSFTQTINHFWGAYVIPEGCGFFLNNQLSSFSMTSSSVHYIQPYKQPVSHIMPTIVMKDGLPFATFGSPGSTRIPAAVLQIALNLMDFDMDMQSAINNGRVFSYAVAIADAGYSEGKKLLEVEQGDGDNMLTPETVDKLAEKNYYVKTYNGRNLYFGGVQGIKFNYDEKGNLVNLTGGADPRRDGKALAY